MDESYDKYREHSPSSDDTTDSGNASQNHPVQSFLSDSEDSDLEEAEQIMPNSDTIDIDSDDGIPYRIDLRDNRNIRATFKPFTPIPMRFLDDLSKATLAVGKVKCIKIKNGKAYGFIRPVESSGNRDSDVYFPISHVKNITSVEQILRPDIKVQYVLEFGASTTKAFMVFLGQDGQANLADAIKVSMSKSDESAPGWDGRGVVVERIDVHNDLVDDEDSFLRSVRDQIKDGETIFYKLHNKYVVPESKLPRHSLAIIPGDKLEFKWSSAGASPVVKQARVVFYAKRPVKTIKRFFKDFTNAIESHPEESSRSLTEILTNNLLWQFLGTTSSMISGGISSQNYLLAVINFVAKVINKALANHKPLMVQALTNFLNSPILTEAAKVILEIRDEEQERVQKIIEAFCLAALQVDPKQGPHLLKIMAPAIENLVGSRQHKLFVQRMLGLLQQSLDGSMTASTFNKDGTRLATSILPNQGEICGESFELDPNLKPVLLGHVHQSCTDYLDQYYHLMKAETFAPIQEVIKKFKEESFMPSDHHFRCVYVNVTLAGLNALWNGLSLSLRFKTVGKKKVKWDKSSQLMYGNLLALSMNHAFTDIIWLTVDQKDVDLLKKDSVILVKVCKENRLSEAEIANKLLKFGGSAVMIESPTFFLPNFPVLRTLRDMDLPKYSLKDCIVNQRQVSGDQPGYLERFFSTHQDESVSLLGMEKIVNQLDPSQTKAFNLAIHSRLAVIQGPPGTGKTFIGIKLASVILKAMISGPILVLTFKNHALDEFLKDMVDVCGLENILRIGGRCQEPILEGRNLKQVFKERAKGDLFEEIWEKRHQISEMTGRLKQLTDGLKKVNGFGIKDILSDLTDDQLTLLLVGNWKNTSKKKGVPFKTKDELEQSIDIAALHFGNLTGFVKRFVLGHLDMDKDPDLQVVNDEAKKLKFYLIHCVTYWLPRKEKLQDMRDMSTEMTSQAYDHDMIHQLFQFNIDNSEDDGEEPPEQEDDEDQLNDIDEDVIAERIAIHDNIADMAGGGFRGVNNQGKKLSLRDQITIWKNTAPAASGSSDTFKISDFPTFIEPISESVMAKQVDLWQLSEALRIRFIYTMLVNQINPVEEEFKQLIEELSQLQSEKEALEIEEKVQVAKTAKVIGMTISGAAIQMNLVQRIAPKVVIVEEAAEVLEPSLLAALSPLTEQLILIGDHKQLRPQLETYELERKYLFNRSMMERLIENNYPFATLQKQNRMRPEISLHLRDIYPALEDNLDRVSKNEPAKCFDQSLFWWSHNFNEDHLANGDPEQRTTKSNSNEADMAIMMALFLIRSGECKPSEVTILASYLGQKKLIRKKLEDARSVYGSKLLPKEDGVDCQTIDNYQGDENKFIIVSMVRSRTLGYLRLLNRRCVAQSRAKCGLFYIGNLNVFTTGNDGEADSNDPTKGDNVWSKMIKNMQEAGQVDSTFVAKCPKHPLVSRYDISSADDFKDLVEGDDALCKEVCNHLMPCGVHRCTLACSSIRHSHEFCHEEVIGKCQAGLHDLEHKCSQDPSTIRCLINVVDTCKDGKHKIDRKCFEPVEAVACKAREPFTFDCSQKHVGTKKCCTDVAKLKCNKICGLPMDCGITDHTCPEQCGTSHDHVRCKKEVVVPIPKCRMSPKHEFKKECTKPLDENLQCKQRVKVVLNRSHCQHEVEKYCHEKDEDVDCQWKCDKMNSCGEHECQNRCGKTRHSHDTCNASVPYVFPKCQHPSGDRRKYCSEEVKHDWKCEWRVEVTLPCGHQCRKKCYQENHEVYCKEPCEKIRTCGHECLDKKCGDKCDVGQCKECLLVERKRMKRAKGHAKRKSDDLMRKINTEGEIFSLDEIDKDSPEFFKVRDKVINYIKPQHNWYRDVVRVDKITNYKLERAFYEAKSKALSDYTDELFHGTGSEGIAGIPRNGFRLPSPSANNMFGQGVYFAPNSSKSAQELYTKGTNKLILSDVVIGKALKCTGARKDLTPSKLRNEGYDSVFVPRGTCVQNDEYVIYDTKRALPKYIIYLSSHDSQQVKSLTGILAQTAASSGSNQGGVTKKRVLPSRKLKLDDPFDVQYRLVESHFRRMIENHPSASRLRGTSLQSVDFVFNADLNGKFDATKDKFKKLKVPDDEIWGYHGTDPGNIDSILTTNLNRKVGQAHGPGFYFSEFPDVCRGYGAGLIMFRLLPGREYKGSDKNKHTGSGRQYHSKIVGGDATGSGQMVIIDDNTQFVPYCVLNLQ